MEFGIVLPDFGMDEFFIFFHYLFMLYSQCSECGCMNWRVFRILGFFLFAPAAGCRFIMPIADGPEDCSPNGVREEGEICDGADLGGLTCQSLGFYGGVLACTSVCRLDNRDCLLSGFCGDGKIQTDFEACDGAELGSQTCESLGYYGGVLACGSDCQLDVSGCIARCDEDGVLEPGEECDGMELGSQTCESLGYYGGILACGSDCQLDASDCMHAGKCGDAEVQPEFEECEPGNPSVVTCQDLGYYPGTLVCAEDCIFDVSGCAGACGDGRMQAEYEECDGTDLGTQTCESLGYYGGLLLCNSDCTLNRAGCTGFCGDGMVQTAFEACDPMDPGRPNCRSVSRFTGEYCSAETCQTDSSRCEDAWTVDARGFTTCAATSAGSARCWGRSDLGQAGDGVASNRLTPVIPQVSGRIVAIQSGQSHTCALLDDATLACWGDNQYGQLGLGHFLTPQMVPAAVPGLGSVTRLDCGADFTCAIHDGGLLSCWGHNQYGQLGIGNTLNQNMPQQVFLLAAAASVSTGDAHVCAVDVAGSVWCWGYNAYGQLGDGTTSSRTLPVQVTALAGVGMVAAGGSHTCAALSGGGDLYCWGNNQYGQLGTGSTFPSRSYEPILSEWPGASVVSLAAGSLHNCAVDAAGSIWCWGYNAYGQLGIGNTNNRSFPQRVSALANGVSATAGSAHSCALLGSGMVYCWGENTYGQLGDGSTARKLLPSAVAP